MGRDKERRVPTSRLKEHLALPARLRALDGHLASSRRGVFADWELERAAPLTKLFPDDEADIVEVVAPRFTVFAGDFAGGLLALDHEGARDVERAAVVCFDSEGGFDVVGTSFDDFLALIASEEADPREDCWQAAEALRRFIVSTGIEPHASAGRRLTELGPATRAFRAGFARALGEASLRVRPDENIVHELVPGERIGEVALGMSPPSSTPSATRSPRSASTRAPSRGLRRRNGAHVHDGGRSDRVARGGRPRRDAPQPRAPRRRPALDAGGVARRRGRRAVGRGDRAHPSALTLRVAPWDDHAPSGRTLDT
jgi:hypothetical protein